MKTTINVILIIALLLPLSLQSFSQPKKAIIYLNRLKKSTESYANYTVWLDDKQIDIMEGTSPIFTTNYYGMWLVFTAEPKNKALVKITNGKNDIKAKILINIEPGEKYFLTFDPSVSVNDNALKLIDNKKGFETLYASNNEAVKILDESIREQVFKDKKYEYLKNSQPENTKDSTKTKPVEKETIQKDNYAFIINNENDKTFQRISYAIGNNEKLRQLLKDGEFDFYKSYNFEPTAENTVMSEMKKTINTLKEKDNMIVFFCEQEKKIYIAINNSSKN